MKNNTTIIRLIDVALIILLGFIAISRLKTEYLDLPSGSDPTKTPQEFHEMSLRLHENSYEVIDQGRRNVFYNLADLESALTSVKARYQQMNRQVVLNIESNRSVIIQSLINVIDICQRNEIQKNLDYVVFE